MHPIRKGRKPKFGVGKNKGRNPIQMRGKSIDRRSCE